MGRFEHVKGCQSPYLFDGERLGCNRYCHQPAAQAACWGPTSRCGLASSAWAIAAASSLKGFLAHADAKIVALCDVYEPYLNGAYDRLDPRFAGLGKRIAQMPKLDGDVARVKDFRAILDRKDIDAVVIATPDHWHAIQMIAACKAGKDVYVEKPLSMTIAEGRAMVDAARQVRPDRAGRHAPPVVADVCAARRGGSLGRDRQGHGGARRIHQQHDSRGDRPCARVGTAGRPRLGHVAGPAAGSTVPVDDHALQVPLVGSLFVADGQLGRPLFRR